VWDIQRLIDWAQTRPDINTRNLLVMGNSGGGVATLFAAACEPRITIAVSSCAFCAFVGQSGRLTHCDCNTVPGLLRFGKIEDIAGLIAPRHLLAVNGRLDTILPVQDVDPAVSETRRIFNVAGAGKQFAHYYGEGGHRFYADLMWPFVMQASGRISASAINCL
jgi:dienelactone hydrolase